MARTRVYVVRSGVRIEPFGDLARDLPVGGVAIHEWQAALFQKFDLEPVEVADTSEIPLEEDRLITADNVVFSRRVLKSFLQRWRQRGKKPSRLALPLDSTFIRCFSSLQDFERDTVNNVALFDVAGLPAGAPADASLEPLSVIYKERVLELPVPRHVTGVDAWIHPVTTSICIHVRHWIHLLEANLLSIQVRWVDDVVSHPIRSALAALFGLVFGRGSVAARVGRSVNRIGKGARIDPSALVEASFIGDGAVVGPRAMVRGSIVCDGAVIEQAADVSFSVIGPRCFVSKHSIVYATSAMEESDLCMKGMQMCLVGRRAALTARASPIDVMPGRRARVADGKQIREVDLPVLGSCYGHDTFIGADIFVGAGRAIPNGVRIVPAPERVLSKIPDQLEAGRAYAVRNGTLEPI